MREIEVERARESERDCSHTQGKHLRNTKVRTWLSRNFTITKGQKKNDRTNPGFKWSVVFPSGRIKSLWETTGLNACVEQKIWLYLQLHSFSFFFFFLSSVSFSLYIVPGSVNRNCPRKKAQLFQRSHCSIPLASISVLIFLLHQVHDDDSALACQHSNTVGLGEGIGGYGEVTHYISISLHGQFRHSSTAVPFKTKGEIVCVHVRVRVCVL